MTYHNTECEVCGKQADCMSTCYGAYECSECNPDDPRHVLTDKEIAQGQSFWAHMRSIPRYD